MTCEICSKEIQEEPIYRQHKTGPCCYPHCDLLDIDNHVFFCGAKCSLVYYETITMKNNDT